MGLSVSLNPGVQAKFTRLGLTFVVLKGLSGFPDDDLLWSARDDVFRMPQWMGQTAGCAPHSRLVPGEGKAAIGIPISYRRGALFRAAECTDQDFSYRLTTGGVRTTFSK